MELNYKLEDINKSNIKSELKTEPTNYFDLCQKCSLYQNNLKDWMKHLVDRHPLPIQWMSDMATFLTGDNLSKPYTTVTESRKKRKKHVTPRPLNSFMIFSRHLRRNVLIFFNDASNSEISKLLGKLWNNIPSHIKSMYDNEAKKLAALHAKEFPDYKYQPKKKKKQYLTKCAMDNYTLLSGISQESVKDICSVSHSLQRESNSASVSSYGSTQESKSNSFINHQKTSHFKKEINHKLNRKSTKQSFNVISNQIIEDSEDAESSPSSFKNTVKNEMHSSYSPFINESHSILSDLSYSSSLANLTKHNSDSVIKSSPNIEENIVMQDYKSSQQNCSTHFRHFFQKTNNNNNKSNNLLTPLTIVTDKVDDSKDFQPSRMNIRFVKINKSLIQKSNTPLNDIFQNIIDKPIYSFGNFSQEINNAGVTNNVSDSYFTNSRNDGNINLINSVNHENSRKRVNIDPLIIENMFENDNFEEDNLNFDNIDNNNGSPWSFKSPNFKISTGSSTLSDNPYKESFCSSSPFHLSENETNPIPIQRLPAIGSWIKSNYSEFMI